MTLGNLFNLTVYFSLPGKIAVFHLIGLLLIPESWECAALHVKKDFADVIKLRIWRRDYPGYSVWAPHDSLSEGSERRFSRTEEKAVWLQRQNHGDAVGCHGMLAAPRSWKRWGRFPSRTSEKEHGPADALILAHWFLTSCLQNCEKIHLCCFKPLNLW